jgi:hypothetical protein
VHDLLQGNLSALAAVFLGYAPMGEKDWLQLLRDACPGTEGLPGSAVFRAVVPAGRTLSFHRFLLALCLMAEHLANPHKRYQIEWAPVLTKGAAAAAAAAAAKADEVASEPKPKPAKKTLGTPTTAKSKPEALVEALDGFLPMFAIHQVIPVRNQVAEWASVIAKRDAAVHTTASLALENLAIKRFVHLFPVLQTKFDWSTCWPTATPL